MITFSGCFENTGVPTGPNVITVAYIDGKTGKGFSYLYFGQSIANCTAVTPVGAPTLTIAVTLSEQTDNFDHDQDGCTDTQELRNTQGTGGLRDPYNRWDFDDQFTGAPPTKDRIVAGGDIGAVVSRFGSSGSPTGDPNATPPAAPAYHTSADRNGSLPGSNGWNARPANGSISVGDVGSVVAQFGHSCTA